MVRNFDRALNPGVLVRSIACEAVRRIDEDAAFANLLVPSLLNSVELSQRDRNMVTEIAYGATRMRRAVDWLVDRFLVSPPGPALRAALRVGAYQLAFMRVPPHAAVSTTVDASAKRNRAAVNAILRKVAADFPVDWPNENIRLSYPDWLINCLTEDLGEALALAMLEQMNMAPPVTRRDDGYRQDQASQWVADLVGAEPRDLVLDVCAAPGGKSTALAKTGACVIASDLQQHRSRLVAENVEALEVNNISVLTADGLCLPFTPGCFDKVLVDAPCSGLGALRRRPDARWRVSSEDIKRLSILQGRILDAAVQLVRPGGMLVYSVCTVTLAETGAVANAFESRHPTIHSYPIVDDRWSSFEQGVRILPQDHDSDGMVVFRWKVSAGLGRSKKPGQYD